MIDSTFARKITFTSRKVSQLSKKELRKKINFHRKLSQQVKTMNSKVPSDAGVTQDSTSNFDSTKLDRFKNNTKVF